MAIRSSFFYAKGYVGKDVTACGMTKNNKPFIKFSVGETRPFGKTEKMTVWYQVMLVGPAAEGFVRQKLLMKGTNVMIIGTFNFSTYKDKRGNEKEAYTVFADDVGILPQGLMASKVAVEAAEMGAQIDQEISDEDCPI